MRRALSIGGGTIALAWMLAGGNAAWAQNVPPATAPAAATQAGPDSGTGLEEIVVTATKRRENLQRVGISITAFSGQRLQQLGYNNAIDIIKQTPGLDILSSSRSNTNVSVRGVSQNDFADHLEGPIAVYADEGYLGTSGAINGQSFDLERVEVLRGPQGTLFGRNATGGAVQYVSVAPTDYWTGYGTLDFGERGLAQLEGAVGGPISDSLRFRASLAGVRDDGYVKNLIGPNPGNRNNISGRLQLVADLSPVTQLRLMVNGNANAHERGLAGQGVAITTDAHGQGVLLGNNVGVFTNQILGGTLPPRCAGCDIFGYKQPSDPFVRALNDTGSFKKDLFHAQAKLTTRLGEGINVTSITDYLHLRKDLLDQDIDGTPTSFFEYNTKEKYSQVSQELRLDGQIGGLKWQTGGYYLHINGHYDTFVRNDISVFVGAPVCNLTPGFPCPTTIPGVEGVDDANYSVKTRSIAGFVQLEQKLSDQFTILGGIRYTHDHKIADYVWTTTALPVTPPPLVYSPATNPTADRSFNNVTGKLELDWHPSRDTMVYASYSRGAKGGNWAFPVFPPPITLAQTALFPHKQEILTDYEVGLKTEFWDHRIRFNVGAFYYDYHNYQAFGLINLAQSISNKDAKAWGGEAELTLAPTKGLEITLGAASMTSRVYDIIFPDGTSHTTQLPFSSKLTVNGSIRYEFPFMGGSLAPLVSFTTVGAHYFDVANEPFVREPRYFSGDARLTFTTADKHWNFAVWCKNFTDAAYRTFAIDISAISAGDQNYASPRWFGGTIGFRY